MCLDTQLMFQSVYQGVRPGCVDQTGSPTVHSNKRDLKKYTYSKTNS